MFGGLSARMALFVLLRILVALNVVNSDMITKASYERIMKALEEQRKLIRKSPEYRRQLLEELGIADLFYDDAPAPKKKNTKKR